MLRLRSITLTQFKNYGFRQFVFPEQITAITGRNGAGKSNLLDAVYYLCFSRSYFSGTDAGVVTYGHAGFRLEGQFERNGESTQVTVILRENGKKELSVNGVPYDRFSLHIGRFPCVMIAPDDVELITGGSELRRRYLDTLLSQTDPDYLQQLIRHNRLLQQRNSYLKQAAQERRRNDGLLDVLDVQLAETAAALYLVRCRHLPQLRQQVLDNYALIAGRPEPIEMTYESPLPTANPLELLRSQREKDYLLQRTTAGIHKDDLLLELQGHPFKTTASQGQRKSLLFGLKLAEAGLLQSANGFAPLLLLDDVFEKLDQQRMHNLLQHVCTGGTTQIFITDTHRPRMEAVFRELGYPLGILEPGDVVADS